MSNQSCVSRRLLVLKIEQHNDRKRIPGGVNCAIRTMTKIAQL